MGRHYWEEEDALAKLEWPGWAKNIMAVCVFARGKILIYPCSGSRDGGCSQIHIPCVLEFWRGDANPTLTCCLQTTRGIPHTWRAILSGRDALDRGLIKRVVEVLQIMHGIIFGSRIALTTVLLADLILRCFGSMSLFKTKPGTMGRWELISLPRMLDPFCAALFVELRTSGHGGRQQRWGQRWTSN